MNITYTGNDHVRALGKFYADTPKAVFAALAFSFAAGLISDDYGGETTDAETVRRRLKREWGILNDNGIVPQKPPKF